MQYLTLINGIALHEFKYVLCDLHLIKMISKLNVPVYFCPLTKWDMYACMTKLGCQRFQRDV
jgi:hypothetical protein